MPKAVKLPSGSWNIRVYAYTDANGKRHYESFTAPTKAEAQYAAASFKKNKKNIEHHEMTVEDAVDRYIDLSTMLSPTTIYRYKQMRDTAFPDLMKMKVSKITDIIMQEEINKEKLRISERTKQPLSAKTVHNEYGLISSALKTVCNVTYNVRLPKKQKERIELPSVETVMRIIKGKEIELPCLLAMWMSFSMSEIRGIKCSSIKNGYISIDQVRVMVGRKSVVKNDAKVESRKRTHKVPEYIMELIKQNEAYKRWEAIHEDGFLIYYSADSLYSRFKRLMQKNGYEMTFHQLRHMNASVMLMLNIPEKYAMERGGWQTPEIMKSVYQHTFSKERQIVDEKIDDFFNSILTQI